jgi:LPXTG-motif cell wall-anchored protein
VTKRIRRAAACLVLVALVVPAAAGASPEPSPGPAEAAPRTGLAGLPVLRPDPNPHPSIVPGDPGDPAHRLPTRSGPGGEPSAAERDALLARVAPLGIRAVVDESGVPALTVDHELVLVGGPDGVAALRGAGLEIAPGPRDDVVAVRQGGRVVAWYIVDPPAVPGPAAPPATNAPPATAPLPNSPSPNSPNSPSANGPPPAVGPPAALGPAAAAHLAVDAPSADLPQTGPNGVLALTVVGLACLLVGLGVVRHARRSRG